MKNIQALSSSGKMAQQNNRKKTEFLIKIFSQFIRKHLNAENVFSIFKILCLCNLNIAT